MQQPYPACCRSIQQESQQGLYTSGILFAHTAPTSLWL